MDITTRKSCIPVLWKDDLLYGYHVNCILDNYLIQHYIPYHICPVVVICADHYAL